jgi:C4-dicarboxylate-specific signal transduction histidine kinase
MSTSPLTNEKGEIIGSVHVARDITESKQMQQQLIISDRLACIGELASGIAHEINNPLTSVICFSQLLLKKELPADVREDLNIIDTGAQRAAAMVKNLLTLARTSQTHRQASQINNIIDDVLKLRAYPLAQDHIEICRRFAPDLPDIMVDCSQMQQVFLNIIMNAEFFMAKAHKMGTLTITTEKVGNIVRISFADDGPGIPKENLNRVFDAFFTTKEAGKGTGLGLSICHNIISEHGGKLYAKEGSTKGATFIIELPLVSPQTRSVRNPEGVNTKGTSIHVDGDQPVMATSSTGILSSDGSPTRIAINAKTTNDATQTP